MPPTAEAIAAAVIQETQACLDGCLERIGHCLGQLSDQQVWWRPRAEMNSIGNLVLHLTGNVRQWIVAGLGGAPNVRVRPQEFAERGPIPKAEIWRNLTAVVAAANEALSRTDAEQLLAPRRIQGYVVTGLGALFDSVPHFRGHTQEIICLTRLQLGDGYKFFWQPETSEQMAAGPGS
jgi:hypothetical protein